MRGEAIEKEKYWPVLSEYLHQICDGVLSTLWRHFIYDIFAGIVDLFHNPATSTDALASTCIARAVIDGRQWLFYNVYDFY